MSEKPDLSLILEAAIMASSRPLTIEQLAALFPEDHRPDGNEIRAALAKVSDACQDRAFELKQVASGFRFQVRQAMAPWIGGLWDEKPQRYTRALLETLALIAYRQPITRGKSKRFVASVSAVISSAPCRSGSGSVWSATGMFRAGPPCLPPPGNSSITSTC